MLDKCIDNIKLWALKKILIYNYVKLFRGVNNYQISQIKNFQKIKTIKIEKHRNKEQQQQKHDKCCHIWWHNNVVFLLLIKIKIII